MKKNYFSYNEIVLCTYVARYNSPEDELLNINWRYLGSIQQLRGRSLASIRMKIQNIAAMLDETNIARVKDISPLSGRPPGKDGRKTNWDWIEPLTKMSKLTLRKMCVSIMRKTVEN